MSDLKAFHVDDSTIFAAEGADSAAALYQEETGEVCTEDYPVELTDEELDKPQPEFDENESATGSLTSIRAWLAEAAPGFLCGTDW